ncbi:MAG TPA: hypothetical protein VG795_08630, partial [Acidimicrobiia bacterium]|nr:hypothetical protein [Acidimicrobiia bacterium]
MVGVAVVALFTQLDGTRTVSSRLDDRTARHGRMAKYGVALDLFRVAPLVGIGVALVRGNSVPEADFRQSLWTSLATCRLVSGVDAGRAVTVEPATPSL